MGGEATGANGHGGRAEPDRFFRPGVVIPDLVGLFHLVVDPEVARIEPPGAPQHALSGQFAISPVDQSHGEQDQTRRRLGRRLVVVVGQPLECLQVAAADLVPQGHAQGCRSAAWAAASSRHHVGSPLSGRALRRITAQSSRYRASSTGSDRLAIRLPASSGSS